ncbi:MAG: ABC transporter permease subunit [Hydrogenophaga sp.]|uniref:ABC transporter permease subunit n=1 Tax=Hydrogenophaga sp. TaxID=1904254 RepID=UPI00403687CB
MNASIWIETLMTGALLGMLYALFGLGLSLSLGVMRMINIAHGDLIVLAAYLSSVCAASLGMGPLASLIVVVPVMFAFGWLLQTWLLNRVVTRDAMSPLRSLLVLATCLVPLILLPWFTGFSTQRLLVEVLTLFTMALAWNLLAGYGGMVAIGHHVFVGIGSYALFAASNELGLNPWLALPLAGAVSAAFALVFAWPMFRLSGAYFAVGTWVLAELMRIIALNTTWLGAGAGMPLTAMGDFGRFERNAWVYWSALAVAVAATITAHRLLKGRLGLALMSLRDSPQAAAASGVPVTQAKLTLWVLTATFTGLAAGVAYMNTLQVSPDASFSLNWTAAAIFIVVLGGIGTLEGPFLGVLVYFVLREVFADFGAWYFIGLGSLAIAVMVLAPAGLWGWISKNGRIHLLSVRRPMPITPPATTPTENHL